ncbi:uncharacterized protein J3D65DRAFT_387110 [Phyllosticta citribraziliensis]|uniref:Mitochondrial pyruvate carrier n=1 Tax=Phyllosticta citribraziliensis TaxID=989973 RepID=A0ABR1LS18_9PEZI
MSFRPTTRILNFSRNLLRQAPRRSVQTAADANAGTASNQSGFSKFLNSPVGPKTVHFWAPVMKWGIVLAGVADFFRPAESLSLSQNMALTATGIIWTRWCLIIRPKNVFLATVNFFLGCVGLVQTCRILAWQNSVKGAVKEEGEAAKKVVEHPVESAKDAGLKN